MRKYIVLFISIVIFGGCQQEISEVEGVDFLEIVEENTSDDLLIEEELKEGMDQLAKEQEDLIAKTIEKAQKALDSYYSLYFEDNYKMTYAMLTEDEKEAMPFKEYEKILPLEYDEAQKNIAWASKDIRNKYNEIVVTKSEYMDENHVTIHYSSLEYLTDQLFNILDENHMIIRGGYYTIINANNLYDNAMLLYDQGKIPYIEKNQVVDVYLSEEGTKLDFGIKEKKKEHYENFLQYEDSIVVIESETELMDLDEFSLGFIKVIVQNRSDETLKEIKVKYTLYGEDGIIEEAVEGVNLTDRDIYEPSVKANGLCQSSFFVTKELMQVWNESYKVEIIGIDFVTDEESEKLEADAFDQTIIKSHQFDSFYTDNSGILRINIVNNNEKEIDQVTVRTSFYDVDGNYLIEEDQKLILNQGQRYIKGASVETIALVPQILFSENVNWDKDYLVEVIDRTFVE